MERRIDGTQKMTVQVTSYVEHTRENIVLQRKCMELQDKFKKNLMLESECSREKKNSIHHGAKKYEIVLMDLIWKAIFQSWKA